MDARRRMLALLAVFVGLLGFHLWLLSRMVARGDAFLSALLVVAIGLFAWRIVHYARRYRGLERPKEEMEAALERRQIRIMAPVLVGLLVDDGGGYTYVVHGQVRRSEPERRRPPASRRPCLD